MLSASGRCVPRSLQSSVAQAIKGCTGGTLDSVDGPKRGGIQFRPLTPSSIEIDARIACSTHDGCLHSGTNGGCRIAVVKLTDIKFGEESNQQTYSSSYHTVPGGSRVTENCEKEANRL